MKKIKNMPKKRVDSFLDDIDLTLLDSLIPEDCIWIVKGKESTKEEFIKIYGKESYLSILNEILIGLD